MQAIWEQAAFYVVGLVIAFVVALLMFGVVALRQWAKSMAAKEDANVAMRGLSTGILLVAEVSRGVVAKVHQETVDEAKKAFADGKITKEELRAILIAAKDAALAGVKEQVWGRLTGELGWSAPDAEKIIDAKIEEAVVGVKALNSTNPTRPDSASPPAPATTV